MLHCPKCNRTYENDTQKFCTRDGGRLIPVGSEESDFDPNATMVSGAKQFDPNATMVSPPSNPNVSQPSFDPNATVLSPPAESTPQTPPSKQASAPLVNPATDQQNYPTIAGTQMPQNPSAPLYNENKPTSQSSGSLNSSTADINTSSSSTQTPSQPLNVPIPARYESSSAPTSSDLEMKSSSPHTSDDLSQSSVPSQKQHSQADAGYNTGQHSAPPTSGKLNYPQSGSASSDLHQPDDMAYMQTQALVTPQTESGRTTNTGELSARPVSMPQNQTATQQSHPAPSAAVVAQRKSSSKKMLLLGLGAVFVALFIVVAAAGVFVVTQRPEWIGLGTKENKNENTNVNNNENTNTSNTNESANTNTNNNENTNTAPPPPPNSIQFENSSTGLKGDLAAHFIPFSFYYPENWTKSQNEDYFVELLRKLPDGFPQEQFGAGYYDSKGTLEADRGDFPALVEKYSTRLSKVFPGYQKISESETTVNGVSGYEFRFTGEINDEKKGLVKFYGRTVFLPTGKEGDKNGVRLVMYGTSLAPELQSLGDFAVKGELPVILSTFKLGQ